MSDAVAAVSRIHVRVLFNLIVFFLLFLIFLAIVFIWHLLVAVLCPFLLPFIFHFTHFRPTSSPLPFLLLPLAIVLTRAKPICQYRVYPIIETANTDYEAAYEVDDEADYLRNSFSQIVRFRNIDL